MSVTILETCKEYDPAIYDQRFDVMGTGAVITECLIKDLAGDTEASFRVFDFSEMRKPHSVKRINRLLDEFTPHYIWEITKRTSGALELIAREIVLEIEDPRAFFKPITEFKPKTLRLKLPARQ